MPPMTRRSHRAGSKRFETSEDGSVSTTGDGNIAMTTLFAGLRVSRKTFIRSVIAGLVMALVSVPGGIANGLLAGVNPISGVYSMIAGTTVAAIFTSSVVMNVDSTGATALATFDALGDLAPEDQLVPCQATFGVPLIGALGHPVEAKR